MEYTPLHRTKRSRVTRQLATLTFVTVLLAGTQPGSATTYPPFGYIDTLVGSGNGDGGPAINAIVEPRGLATCGSPADLYIADGLTNRVRMVEGTTGDIITVAGTGVAGYSGDGGSALSAKLKFPTDVLCDANGNVYVADTDNNCVRRIDRSGIITTIAGTGTAGSGGDGGPATQALLWAPRGLALDSQGNIYIAEFSGNRIRKVSNGIITTIAGTGSWGSLGDGGPATQATLANPSGVAIDAAGRIFIADYNNSKIRVIDVDGKINTIAGDGYQGFVGDGGPAQASRLKLPYRLRFDGSGNLFFLDSGNERVRRLQANSGVVNGSSTVTTVAGNGNTGSTGDGGSATNASFWYLNGLAIDSTGKLYIGVTINSVPSTDDRVRVVSPTGIVDTMVGSGNGDGGPAINALIDPRGIETSANDLYIADANNNRIRFVDGDTQIITTVAGSGVGCASSTTPCGDGGSALNAQFKSPFDVTRDGTGVLYIADTLDNRIRRVNASGIVSTVAGAGNYGLGGDGGDATRAYLALPYGIAVNSTGSTLYIADFANNRVRKVENGIITTFAGTSFGNSGDGGAATAARLASPADVAIGNDGMIYIADYGNNTIRRVRTDGIIERVAGTGTACTTPTLPCGDGGSALNAQLYQPFRMVFDSAGMLYIGDSQTRRIRRVDLSTGIITTVAGTGNTGIEGDGGPALNANMFRGTGLSIDSLGHLYISQSDSTRIRVVSMSANAQATATPTPTPTATLAPTATRTATSTPIPSPTLPPTSTSTPIPTSTPTKTQTWTPTLTWTPTTTPTSSFTPSWTPTTTRTTPPTATPTSLGGSLLFGGGVRYFSNAQPVADALVTLDSPILQGLAPPQINTDLTGQYLCPELPQDTWTAKPSRFGGMSSAITALDATKILQAAVGMTTLNMEQRFACDANGSGSITAIDASLVLQMRVGLITSLPASQRCNSDWLFIPSQADPGPNQDLIQPSLSTTGCVQGGIAFQPLVTSVSNQNFEGVLFGDCNGSWTPSSGGGGSATLADVRLGRPRVNDTHVQIPVFVNADRPFSTVELKLRYDANELSMPRVRRSHAAPHALLQANTRTAGVLAVALASTEPMSSGQVLTLHFESNSSRRAPHLAVVQAGVE